MSTPWEAFSAEGLALAKQGQWVDARDAFQQALRLVESRNGNASVTSVANDDIRARLLLNIGQCHFHIGSFEESRRFAERSCALRVSLYGEDSLIVARTRSDLAVILAASGHTDEAMSLLERAVAAVERKRGSESSHLLPLFTNAARLLARGAPEQAAPYLARLKALKFAQQLVENARHFPTSEVPAHSFAGPSLASSSEDHLLRTAVAQTVNLLRSTPVANTAAISARTDKIASVVAIEPVDTVERLEHDDQPERIELAKPAESVPVLPSDGVVLPEQLTGAVSDIHSDVDAAVVVAWEYEDPPPAEAPKISGSGMQADAGDDRLFNLVEPPPPTLSAIPKASAREGAANANPLGFEVQYGIPSQLHESFANPTAPLPQESGNEGVADPYGVQPTTVIRNGQRAIGGVRRGSAQVVAMNRLWTIVAPVAAFGGGIGAFFLYRYLKTLMR